jgi:O-antigen/teichoic acid export membrane protein
VTSHRRESIASRIGWSTVSTAAAFVASAGAAIAIGRFVDPAEYGRYAVVSSVWGFLVVPIVWCGSVLVRFGPVELAETGRMSRAVGVRIVLAAPALLLLPAVPLLVAPRAGWPSSITLLTLAWFGVTLAENTLQWASSATQQFRAKAVANVLSRGLPALLVASPVVLRAFNVRSEHLLAAVVAANAVSALYLALALRRWVGVAWPGRELLRRSWRYMAPATVGVPAESLVQWVDPLILARFVTRAEVGFYQLAYVVISASATVAASFTAVLTNELVWARARGDDSVQRAYVRTQQPRLALGLGFTAFAAACVAEPALRWLLGARFAPSGRIAAVLAVAAGFQMASITLAPIRTVTDAQAESQASRVLQAAVNVGGDLLLAPGSGTVGVALANLLAWAANGVSLTLLLRRRAALAVRPWIILGAGAGGALLLVAVDPPTWARVAAAIVFAGAAARAAAGLVGSRGGAAAGETPPEARKEAGWRARAT